MFLIVSGDNICDSSDFSVVEQLKNERNGESDDDSAAGGTVSVFRSDCSFSLLRIFLRFICSLARSKSCVCRAERGIRMMFLYFCTWLLVVLLQ